MRHRLLALLAVLAFASGCEDPSSVAARTTAPPATTAAPPATEPATPPPATTPPPAAPTKAAPTKAAPTKAAVVATPRRTPVAVRTSAKPSTCGAPANPWGYNFCGKGGLIYDPPASFCDVFDCIASFWKSTNGYVMQCDDLTFSHSGGRSGSCSHHGGNNRPLYG